MFKRRDFIQLAGKAAALGAVNAVAPALAQDQAGETAAFSGNNVYDLARALASKPFAAPAADLPSALDSLSYENFIAIRAKPEGLIWNDDSSGFVIEPLHRGSIFKTAVQIYLVEGGASHKLNYDASQFDFGRLNLPSPPAKLDFSGFRLLRRSNSGETQELATFQGASFFRSLAPSQNFGVTSRGLTIRTGDARGEEIPVFRAFWIEKASRAANALTVHALLDSESVAGAYRITIHPGDATIIDVEGSLFPRATIDNYGLAAMSATCFFNPVDRRGDDDVRNAAAELSGLQMLTGAGEWVWRPVSNRNNLQISEFVDSNPKGFGFLQRDRDFDDFYDLSQHWERRPSLWIEPIGDWGPGSVELVEIPSDNENAQNMIAFWRSKTPLAKGQQADFAYRQFWCWSPPAAPPVATTADSRGGHGVSPKERRFLIEFSGGILGDAPRMADAKANLSVSPGKIVAQRLYPAMDRKKCYVQFDIDVGGETACELRLTLEAQGAPISETWLYRWTT